MTLAFSRFLTLVATACLASGVALAIDGCASDTPDPVGDPGSDAASPGKETGTSDKDSGGEPIADGGTDSALPEQDAEAGASTTGETCIGFGKGTPCGTATFPDYGYVCFNGSPPGIAGCKLASSTGSFGDTYCCTENKCVAQPDQDKECKTAGAPRRFQCPPNGDAGPVMAPAGCISAGSGGSAVENFYCCP